MQQLAAAAQRVAADLLFLFGDHQKQTIERLARDIAIQVGILRVQQFVFGCFAGKGVVFVGQAGAGRGLMYDGQEFFRQLVVGGALKILGCCIFRATKNFVGILHRHVLDRIYQQGFGFGDRCFRRAVHGDNQLISLFVEPQHAPQLGSFFQRLGQRNPDLIIGQKAIVFTQLANGKFGAANQGFLQPGRGLATANGA